MQITNREYLQHQQYHNASKLDARIRLHQSWSTNTHRLPRWLFDQLQIAPRSFVLEVGAGSGNIWQENSDRVATDWRMLLTDFSPGMIEQTRETLAQTLPHAAFAVADAQHLPLPNATFDAVLANFMLYHVPDREQAISELRRVLKPGSRLYAATNGWEHMRELFDLAQRFDPSITPWGGLQASAFSLENGAAQLERHFSHVNLLHYQDGLLVSQAQPIVDYVASFAQLSQDQHAALAEFVEAELARQNGMLVITKASGLFVAQA